MSFLIINSDDVISTRITATRQIANVNVEGIDSIKYFDFNEFWEEFVLNFLNSKFKDDKERTAFIKKNLKEKIF